jgi:hypothetical protein
MTERKRWWAVVWFALAMAWMEAATVVYLRTLVGRLEPYQANPLPIAGPLGTTEVAREVATMVMLGTAAWLAGTDGRRRFGYWMIAFGIWDLFYYVFLAVIGPWPRSVWDWDILFLLPLPWWGPVAAPASIAVMMLLGGTLVTQTPYWPSRRAWTMNLAGAGLALAVFMWDALRVMGGGPEALRTLLPTSFQWPLFGVALALLAVPVLEGASSIGLTRRSGQRTRSFADREGEPSFEHR